MGVAGHSRLGPALLALTRGADKGQERGHRVDVVVQRGGAGPRMCAVEDMPPLFSVCVGCRGLFGAVAERPARGQVEGVLPELEPWLVRHLRRRCPLGWLVREQRQDALGSLRVSGRVRTVCRRAGRVAGGNNLSERFLREMHGTGACGETGECSVKLHGGCCVTPTAICSVGARVSRASLRVPFVPVSLLPVGNSHARAREREWHRRPR